ncbi:MAG: hypothetical protein ACRYFW_11025 [Janthinobacterium lividum]
MKHRLPPVAGFPPYPEVAPLPETLTDDEARQFALGLIAEKGPLLGDYLFAAVRLTEGDLMMRWVEMMHLVDSLHDGPVHLSYRACDRMAAERAALAHSPANDV